MGNRACVLFRSDDEWSPCVYLHWGACELPRLLAELRLRMKGREGDLDYTCARFIGICHEATPGNMSLGVRNHDTTDAQHAEACSPGDAGVFVVNVQNWRVLRVGRGSVSECYAPPRFTCGEEKWTREQWIEAGGDPVRWESPHGVNPDGLASQ